MLSELNLRAMTLHTHFRTQLQKFPLKELLTVTALFLKVQVNLVLCLIRHQKFRRMGNGGIPPLILISALDCGWVVSLSLRLLYLWKDNPWYSLNRRLGEPQRQSGSFGEKIFSSCPESKPRSTSSYPSH